MSSTRFWEAMLEDHNVFFTPSFIRTLHPVGFRPGEWAQVVGVVRSMIFDRLYFVVEFDDEARDTWVIGDPDGRYEFR